MLLDDLLSKRLVLVSGKGGVGKSLVGAALATAGSGRGQRVLLAEIDGAVGPGRYLEAHGVGSHETEIRPNLFAVNLRPRDVMDEYVRHVAKVGFLARRVLESPIYERFFTAAPGLKELMVLGKLMVLEEEREGLHRRPRYDIIVVDAPATGHGLSLLSAPLAAQKAAPVGPIGANARRILRLLRDPERTALVIVTVPEEMAVVEAMQLQTAALDVGMRPAAIVLNACHERRFTEAQEAEILRLSATGAYGRVAPGLTLGAALLAGRRQLRRARLSRFYERRLRHSLPLPVVRLPYLFRERLGPDDVRLLADRLAWA
jgi:anion-transporting  ArsA/GET3 family ATPase